jgi:spore germination protein YaaH/flagellar hook assembly protein FlgD
VAVLMAGVLPGSGVAGLDRGASDAGPTDARPRDDAARPPGALIDVRVDREADGAGDAPVGHPSIAYEEAMAHANDQIEFAPGGRVKVGFTPRARDAWPIDGRPPTALPGGRATGREMAASAEGSLWANTGRPASAGGAAPGTTPTETPADVPSGVTAIPARSASVVASPPGQGPGPAAASGLRRQVFGFLPYWELSGASTKLNYGVLSTIAYFSVGADRAGNLRKKDADGTNTTGWGGWASANMTSVISSAHERGTRVVLTISVFAWTTSQAAIQKALLGSPAARLRLAKQAAASVRDRGADGINLDFEPLASGYADEFVALLRTMRTELNRVRKGYQLTYDTTGYIGNYPLEASVANGAADAIFIMGYDYRTSSSGTAGSIDPLSGPGYDLADTVRSYTARVSPSRVILGIPWYGRAWSTADATVRSKSISGAKYGYSAAVSYENVVDLVAANGRQWDPVEQSPYVVYRRRNCTSTYGCVTAWRQVYYDDATSLKRRYALVNDYNLRGAGMWALGYDGGHSELYRAVSESFLVDVSAPQSGVRLMAPTQADEGFVVGWAARDTSAVVGYDVQVSVDGGAWAPWLTGTKATSDVWLGSDGHGYAFRVRAVDARGNAGTWNVGATWDASPPLVVGGFGRVAADGLAYRTGPDTSAAKLGTLAAGTIVALTRGPVSADGFTWYEVTEPIREWAPVSFVERGVWLAAKSSSDTYVKAYRAPNSTLVDAGIRRLDFGPGPARAVGAGAAQVALRAFSPDGDGSGDAMRLRWTNAQAMDSMTLRVYRTNGTLVGSRTVPSTGAGAQAWDWNGAVGGTTVRDGRYVLQLVGTASGQAYRAPSSRPLTPAQVGAYGITVDTVAPSVVSASASTSLISPNGDGTLDRVRLALAASGATRWVVRIASSAGTVRTTGGGGASFSFTWRGEDDAGGRVPDGRYTATLLAYDNAGNSARRSYGVTLDTAPPAVARTASPAAFSPNGDGASDTTRLSWSASETVSGTARVLKGATVVRSWRISGATTGAMTWDGRATSGHRVTDGRYAFRVDVRDAGGNRTIVTTPVVVDRTAGFLRWSGAFYPQDADGLAQSSTLSWSMARDARATLRIYDAGGHLVRTAWVGRALHAGRHSWAWRGKLDDGRYVPQGQYEARLTVTSALGTSVLSRPVWAAAFSATPSATTVKAKQTLRVTFRASEQLSSKPVVTFRQPGRSAVSVTATRLADGSYRASFTVRSGAAGAGSLQVSAKDARGQVDRTSIAIKVAS